MKIHWRALKGQPDAPFLALDLLVMLLIAGNLLWLLLDAVLFNSGTGVLLAKHYPGLVSHYRDNIHPDILLYDSYFTFFLIAELMLRWGVAIYRKTYHRWFFYPFVHWYDVLGCIPLPFFRFLRLLRLFSILYRLQTLRVIDLSETGPFPIIYKYYRVVLEELSDRIVINVLEGVQREVSAGGPFRHRLTEEVLRPRRDVIVPWLAGLLTETSAFAYGEHRERLAVYLHERSREAIANNPDLSHITQRLPFVGSALERELQTIVGDLLVQITDDVLTDLGSQGNEAVADIAGGLFDTLTQPHTAMGDAVSGIVLDSLELIKAQVAVQQWKAAGTRGDDVTES
ncbi:MAG TPA: hypothetical protein DF427_00585 [Moraxellaceae bacterium]|nr:hypothetical protein [Moraxellaceae bacterium]